MGTPACACVQRWSRAFRSHCVAWRCTYWAQHRLKDWPGRDTAPSRPAGPKLWYRDFLQLVEPGGGGANSLRMCRPPRAAPTRSLSHGEGPQPEDTHARAAGWQRGPLAQREAGDLAVPTLGTGEEAAGGRGALRPWETARGRRFLMEEDTDRQALAKGVTMLAYLLTRG